MSDENKQWLVEYESFLQADATVVPKEVTDSVLSAMDPLLHPPVWQVFAKLLGIHLTVGLLSLSVCHQFGMNPFGTEMSLDRWFMAMWGHNTCMIVCGVLFTSLSFLCAGYFLSIEEVRVLRRTGFMQALVLGAISLGIFAFNGAELALTFAGLWMFGALLGGSIASEVVWKMRRIWV